VRKANASVAGGALDYSPARLEQTLILSIFNHEQCGTILDRTARVLEFGFA